MGSLCAMNNFLAYTPGRTSMMSPPPGVTAVPYDSVASTLNTGDIMLFSGVTSSGAVIKFFDDAKFSHVGIVSTS